ncbi:unnamed protein product [Leptosia nina]|uniref:Uncharacterized protein n=1 Tax=Leptosia nina TaxID=320188 RepID=A0AAV1JHP4_9NEOP
MKNYTAHKPVLFDPSVPYDPLEKSERISLFTDQETLVTTYPNKCISISLLSTAKTAIERSGGSHAYDYRMRMME